MISNGNNRFSGLYGGGMFAPQGNRYAGGKVGFGGPMQSFAPRGPSMQMPWNAGQSDAGPGTMNNAYMPGGSPGSPSVGQADPNPSGPGSMSQDLQGGLQAPRMMDVGGQLLPGGDPSSGGGGDPGARMNAFMGQVPNLNMFSSGYNPTGLPGNVPNLNTFAGGPPQNDHHAMTAQQQANWSYPPNIVNQVPPPPPGSQAPRGFAGQMPWNAGMADGSMQSPSAGSMDPNAAAQPGSMQALMQQLRSYAPGGGYAQQFGPMAPKRY